ncbi:hypothetical protein A5320_05035 [Rheinheimera sp. SA_1]|uniref:outer membrane lipoprotein-sorting protein n=1 Tax=Rheinheimera sp. SA_1 TaxID=1827365 RepID=UPI0007FC762C|nr:outer membrane lipoprotein-sorting protein [Rheinheimera sp. SA_1]OBP16745.1 hypothetical protein A5320_05035 [Rheinheimera sp. SA_1]
MKILSTLLLLLSLLGLAVNATEPMTELQINEYQATQLINKSWQLYRSQTAAEAEQLDLTITRYGEAAQHKTLQRWTRYLADGEQVVIKFDTPTADRGLGLWIDSSDRQQQQLWLQLPSWYQPRRMDASAVQQYFAGSDLTFEDHRQLTSEDTSQFRYRLLSTSKSGWWLEAVPRNPATSAYSRREIWLNADYAITQINFFDQQGQLQKSLKNQLLQRYANGGWRPNRIEVENLHEQRLSVFQIVERHFGNTQAERMFSQEVLGE